VAFLPQAMPSVRPATLETVTGWCSPVDERISNRIGRKPYSWKYFRISFK
jgi:hypothetical protein